MTMGNSFSVLGLGIRLCDYICGNAAVSKKSFEIVMIRSVIVIFPSARRGARRQCGGNLAVKVFWCVSVSFM